jgi:quinoprotein glucose dehydrogenase
LNAITGAKLWEFDPKLGLPYGASEVTSRGVSAWRDTNAPSSQTCTLRIFVGTLDARLIALDGATGKPCADFGNNGEVDLTADVKLRDPGDYQVTSAPAIFQDLVITGSSIGDNRAVTLERGIVRAFDVHTGKLCWSWDPIAPWAYQTTPRTGAGNAWSTLSVDVQRGLVFIPTGSASPDYYGGIRKGDNKWANSVISLKAATGEFVWGFQVVHHDLWDYDVASQPTLFAWKDGTPAIAITTKMGRVFVLNRLTGAPLLPVEERPVPKSDASHAHNLHPKRPTVHRDRRRRPRQTRHQARRLRPSLHPSIAQSKAFVIPKGVFGVRNLSSHRVPHTACPELRRVTVTCGLRLLPCGCRATFPRFGLCAPAGN